MNEITTDELRSKIKEEMDLCTKKEFNLLSKLNLAVVLGACYYIYNYWQNIIKDFFDILPISVCFLILIYPIFYFMYWYEERDRYRTDVPKLSTFYTSPFICHHLLHIAIYITSIISLVFFAKYTSWPFLLYGVLIIIFESYFAFKKKGEKKDILPTNAIVILLFVISSISITVYFISFIKTSSLNIYIKPAAILCSIYYFIYHIIFVLWLSPNRRLYAKLRKCLNRLNSREKINVPEEVNHFYKSIKGSTFSELFDEKLNISFRLNELIEIKQEKLLYELRKIDSMNIEQKAEKLLEISTINKEIFSLLNDHDKLVNLIKIEANKNINYLSKTSEEDEQERKKVYCLLDVLSDLNSKCLQNIKNLNTILEEKLKELIKEAEANEHICIFSPIYKLFGEKWCKRVSKCPKPVQKIIIKICITIIRFRKKKR